MARCERRRRPCRGRLLGLGLATAALLLVEARIVVTPSTASSAPVDLRPQTPPEAARALREDTPGPVQVVDGAVGRSRLVGTQPGRPVPAEAFGADAADAPDRAAREFLDRYGAAFGVHDPVRQLDATRVSAGPGGQRDVRFVGTHAGLPVLGAEVVVTVEADGDVASAHGEVATAGGPTVSAAPGSGVTAEQARAVAVRATARAERRTATGLQVGVLERWAYDPALLGPQPASAAGPGTRPVWRVEVRATQGPPVDRLVLVDDTTGQVVLSFDQVTHARRRLVCDGGNRPMGEFAARCVSARAARAEGGAPSAVADVNRAYANTGTTWRWYRDVLGVDLTRWIGTSMGDGYGPALRSTVRYCPIGSRCPYANAFWNGEQAYFGAGFAHADDVVAHELAHGMTARTADLFFYYQSGAINESMSDAFGELVDLANGTGTDTRAAAWRIGEDLPGIGAFRDMADPARFGQPDQMTSTRYDGDPDLADNGGVHANSGVGNKAAYLISEGGTFGGRTVTGLGRAKTARLYWRTLRSLTSGSDYADLAAVLVQSCRSLVSARVSGFAASDCQEVTDAVAAVAMAEQPVVAGAVAPHARLCPAAGARSGALLYSHGFERLPLAGWRLTSGSHGAWRHVSGYAHRGSYALQGYLRDRGTARASMTTDVRLPAGGGPSSVPVLRFAHAYELGAAGSPPLAVLSYSTDGGQRWQDAGDLLADRVSYAGQDGFTGVSHGYVASRADLASLKGRLVRFRFEIRSPPGSLGTGLGWVVDDLRMFVCRS